MQTLVKKKEEYHVLRIQVKRVKFMQSFLRKWCQKKIVVNSFSKHKVKKPQRKRKGATSSGVFKSKDGATLTLHLFYRLTDRDVLLG